MRDEPSGAPESGSPASPSQTPVDYWESFSVRSYEVGAATRLSLVSLNRMLQEIAWQHAQRLGWGLIDRDGGYYWVLSRLRMTIRELPAWGDGFVIRTFPVGTDRILAIREFVLEGDHPTPLARVHTGWLIVDSTTQRPVRPERFLEGVQVAHRQYDGQTGRLPDVAPERVAGPFHVRVHDIDQYQHVNNSAYLEWMLDSLELSFLTRQQPVEVQVDYLQETLPGDSYRVGTSISATPPETVTAFQVLRERPADADVTASAGDGPTVVCRALIRWRA